MTKWFDSHGHLNDERFDEDRESLIERLPSLGVGAMVVVGYDKDPARCALPVAKKAPWLYAALGVHPHEAEDWTDEIEEDLIRQCKDEKVVALGEIGLDYHYDFSPRDVQKRVFARQIELAKRLDLPIVVHMREATADTLASKILKTKRQTTKISPKKRILFFNSKKNSVPIYRKPDY